MSIYIRCSILSICLLLCLQSRAEEKNRFFSNSDDSLKKYVLQKQWDFAPDANAVMLFEKVNYSIARDETGFYISRSVHAVIKILNKSGLKYADVSVPMYFSKSHAVSFKKVSGTTYNVENGKLVSQELSSDAVKKDAAENDVVIEKFSMPSVKEGSVIEYNYRLEEDFRTFFTWDFETDIPKVYTEINLMHPNILNVGCLLQSMYEFKVFDDRKKSVPDSLVPLAYKEPVEALSNAFAAMKWVRRNVAAYEDEPFVYNARNYNEKIILQVSGIYTEGRGNMYATWDKATSYLYHNEDCFKPLTKKMGFLQDETDRLTAGKTDPLEKAKAIFSFVRNRFDCNGHATIWRQGDIEAVYNRRIGNVTEINLILTKMMRLAGLESSPVILSTRRNLRIVELYPLLSRFNYTICRLSLPDTTLYLDASDKNNPFGILPAECYNGYARVIDETPAAVVLNAAMLKERSVMSVHTLDNAPGNYTVLIEQSFGPIAAHNLRAQWQKDSTDVRKYVVKLLKSLTLENTLLEYNINNLDDPDLPLHLSVKAKISWPTSGSILMQPCSMVQTKENPFSANHRMFPVEMRSATQFVYSCYLKLPAGYVIGTLPPSVIYKLYDKNEYRYLMENDTANNAIQLRTELIMPQAYFEQPSYDDLKAFYGKMIECEKQPVILKKTS